ncbi:VOC family protein [Candidatus Rariloculus sp.]|uniref:VOC family protein n=1 Tax=Candidatus Rariloculus sp. TaxID=3101265 RepID=UPI003D0DD578
MSPRPSATPGRFTRAAPPSAATATDDRTGAGLAGLTRRRAVGGLCALAATPLLSPGAFAQAAAATPLDLPLAIDSLINHIGVSVPDVIASATFHGRLFGGNNPRGEREPFLRYFINLNPGSVAIGPIGTFPASSLTVPHVDHYCVSAAPFDAVAWQRRLETENLAYLGQGVFGDPDGIAIQVAGGQGGESLAAGSITELDPLYTGTPLVVPRGFDHLLLRVSSLDATAAFYERMFGFEVARRDPDRIWISDGDLRLAFREAQSGEVPGIDSYAVRTEPFDRPEVSARIASMGGETGPVDGAANALRLTDPDGIRVELWPS